MMKFFSQFSAVVLAACLLASCNKDQKMAKRIDGDAWRTTEITITTNGSLTQRDTAASLMQTFTFSSDCRFQKDEWCDLTVVSPAGTFNQKYQISNGKNATHEDDLYSGYALSIDQDNNLSTATDVALWALEYYKDEEKLHLEFSETDLQGRTVVYSYWMTR